MKKYWTIIKIEISRQFTYRSNILAFVVGNFLEVLSQVVVWTAVYKSQTIIKGYTYEEMMTYVIVGWFFSFITTNYSFENVIEQDISEGTLSNFITKPISYLRYIIAKAGGRIFIAFLVVILQSIFLFLLFSKFIILNISIYKITVLLVLIILAYFIKLFFAILIGTISFWTVDVSGIFSTLNKLVKFLSGGYFPVNLLPITILHVSMFFPFIYTLYVPVRFFMGKMSIYEAMYGVLVQMIWLFALYLLIKITWKLGTKKYESVGI